MSDEKVLKRTEKARLMVQQVSAPHLIIATGIMLLAANIFQVPLLGYLWPGFIIAPGLLLLEPARQSTAERQSRLSFLAVPGALLVAIGGLLLVMNMVTYFEAWAYSWPLLPAAVAGGLMYMRRHHPDHPVHERGYRFIRFMFFGFIGMVLFFELIVWGHFNPLLPLALILFGIYLLRRERTAVAPRQT